MLFVELETSLRLVVALVQVSRKESLNAREIVSQMHGENHQPQRK